MRSSGGRRSNLNDMTTTREHHLNELMVLRQQVAKFEANIAEAKQQEKRLLDYQSLYRTVVENVTDAIIINVGTTLVFVNNAFLTLHGLDDKSQALGVTLENFILPEDLPLVRERTLARQRGEPVPGVYEYRVRRSDGEERTVQTSATAIIYDGQPAELAVLRDITERKQLEELRHREISRLATIGQLAAGVAHEINNPLGIILGFAELGLKEASLPKIYQKLEAVVSETQRAGRIVHNLLSLAREQEPLKQCVDLAAILERAIELKSYEFKFSNINVTTQFSPDLPHVPADSFEMTQAVLNILANAQEAMLDANGVGEISICAYRSDNKIRVSIRDNGPGILPEHLNRVFEPFFTTKETGNGIGLGLSLAHATIRHHGGDLWAESEVGNGATIHFELPIPASAGGQIHNPLPRS